MVEEDGNEETPIFWMDEGKKTKKKFWCNKEGVLMMESVVGGEWRKRICLPEEMAGPILRKFHEEGHWGAKRTREQVREYFVWSGMNKDCEEFCASCHVCQTCNKTKKLVGKMGFLEAKERGELLGIDTFSGIPRSGTGSGNEKILVFTDMLTRFCWLVAVLDTKAETVAKAILETWCKVLGPPKRIITDFGRDGGEFDNELCQAVYRLMNIEKLSTVTYRPEAMGMVERFNKTMLGYLTKNCESQADWENKLISLMWQYNGALHSVTGYSPAFLMFGRELNDPIGIGIREEGVEFNIEKWVMTGVPEILEAVKDAARLSREAQIENARKFNEKNMDRIGEKILGKNTWVLVMKESKTNLDKGEHKKLFP